MSSYKKLQLLVKEFLSLDGASLGTMVMMARSLGTQLMLTSHH